MGKILNLSSVKKRLENEIKQNIKDLPPLKIASLYCGRDYSAGVYVLAQAKAAAALGIGYLPVELKKDAPEAECLEKLSHLNADNSVDGIIVNKPFPPAWNEENIFSAIAPAKDIEGVTPLSLGGLFWGEGKIIPPTVLSVLEILEFIEVDLYGKDVVVVGFSAIIGKPLALILAGKYATVTITHVATYQQERLPFYLKNADIIISAVGKPHIIPGEWIKEGAVVIDVGIGEKDGKTVGDVDFESAKEKASFITPVPGGVGRLTTLFLLDNLVKAAKFKK